MDLAGDGEIGLIKEKSWHLILYQSGKTLNQTRNPILQNFTSINSAFNVNHGDFGAPDAGKHKFLQMPEQGMAPTTAVNEAALYAAVGVSSGVTELFFRRENNNANPIAFTEGLAAQRGS